MNIFPTYGLITTYNHLEGIAVPKGQLLQAGDIGDHRRVNRVPAAFRNNLER